jgi:hypothetical protein
LIPFLTGSVKEKKYTSGGGLYIPSRRNWYYTSKTVQPSHSTTLHDWYFGRGKMNSKETIVAITESDIILKRRWRGATYNAQLKHSRSRITCERNSDGGKNQKAIEL